MSKKKKIVIILVAVLAVLLMGASVTLVVVLSTNKDDSPKDPTVSVSVADEVYFAGQPLSSITLVLSGASTAGTVSWVDETITLSEGTNSYDWIFYPEDSSKYKTATGSVEIYGTPQEIVSIEIRTPATKVSGYYAFEEFDPTGLVITAIYNNGNTYQIETGFEIVYANADDSLRAADTYVTINYLGKTVNHTIEAVSKISVETPTKTLVYNSEEQSVTFEDSDLYEFNGTKILSATNVGTYTSNDVLATLIDFENYEWKDNTVSSDISVILIITKAEQTITDIDGNEVITYTKEYSGEANSFCVYSNAPTTIYYSETELNDENYNIGTERQIELTDVGEKVIYYYALSTENYNAASGQITITITKSTPTVSVKSIVTFETGSEIQANYQMVTVSGLNSFEVSIVEDDITFEYYSDSSCLSPLSSISEAGVYYVVATYVGNSNYISAKSEAAALVVYDETVDYFELNSDDDFVWESDDSYSLTFEKTTMYGLTVLMANINDPNSEDELVYISYEDENYIATYNDTDYIISISNDVLTLTQSGSATADYKFEKYVIDVCVGTYTCVYEDENGKGGTNILTITYSKKSYYFEYTYVLDYDYGQGLYNTLNCSGTAYIEDRYNKEYDKYIYLIATSSSLGFGVLWYNTDPQTIFSEGLGNCDDGTYTKQS